MRQRDRNEIADRVHALLKMSGETRLSFLPWMLRCNDETVLKCIRSQPKRFSVTEITDPASILNGK